jgi:hypothetical protein
VARRSPAVLDSSSLLVKPDVAARQVEEERAARSPDEVGAEQAAPGGAHVAEASPRDEDAAQAKPRRFLVSQGDVKLRLEVEADMPGGAPDNVVRTVNENAKVLKFDSFGFEEEWSSSNGVWVHNSFRRCSLMIGFVLSNGMFFFTLWLSACTFGAL